MKNESVESLNDSCRWGCRPKAFPMPNTAFWVMPVCSAMERVDQWVPGVGLVSRVAATTASTWASRGVRRGIATRYRGR